VQQPIDPADVETLVKSAPAAGAARTVTPPPFDAGVSPRSYLRPYGHQPARCACPCWLECRAAVTNERNAPIVYVSRVAVDSNAASDPL
jgi:hypothetical protein